MSFPTESEDSQPQVAMTFNKDKSLKLTARSSSGEFLYINGEIEYILGPNMQTKGLVIHREGLLYVCYAVFLKMVFIKKGIASFILLYYRS